TLTLRAHLPPPPRSTLFPYTTLFRSQAALEREAPVFDGLPFQVVLERGHVEVLEQDRVELLALARQHILGGHRRAEVEGVSRERSEEHTSELQSRENLVCRLLLEKKN